MPYWPVVTERELRRLSRALRAATAAVLSGEGDALSLALLAEDVRRARQFAIYEGGGLYGFGRAPSARQFRRTREDAKQTVRRAEIVLAGLER
jgi:hypothetical protein